MGRGIACPANAANVYVNAAATGGNTGVDWANAYTSLTSAMPGSSGDVIHVAEGTYSPGVLTTSTFSPGSGVTMLGGYSALNSAGIPRNPTVFRTILDADVNGDDIVYDLKFNTDEYLVQNAIANERKDNNNNLIFITSGTSGQTIDGFILIGGTEKVAGGGSGGGGIQISEGCSNITIRNCQFLRNMAYVDSNGGAGIMAVTANNLLVEDCYFYGNACDWCKGAAINCYTNVGTAPCTYTINRCVFEGNANMQDYFGGILYFQYRFAATVKDCLFIDNGGSTNSNIIATDARYAMDQSLDITNCAFIGNRVVNRSTIYLYTRIAAPNVWNTSVKNCLFLKNASGITSPLITGVGRGTAIQMRPGSATAIWNMSVTNCTIADNQDLSEEQPALWLVLDPDMPNPTTLTIKNNIIWNNKGLNGSPSFGGWDPSLPGTLTVNYNCISTSDPNDYLPAGSVGNMMADPQFVNPAIGDYHLTSTSPCIDKGDPASAYANEPKWLNGCRVNMGAYGNTKEAATTTTCVALTADTNGDCRVNNADLLTLRGQWLKTCP